MEYEPWVQEAHRQNTAFRRSMALPTCDECGETIQSDTCVRIGGCRYCPRCIRRSTVPTEETEEVEPWSRSGLRPGRRWS